MNVYVDETRTKLTYERTMRSKFPRHLRLFIIMHLKTLPTAFLPLRGNRFGLREALIRFFLIVYYSVQIDFGVTVIVTVWQTKRVLEVFLSVMWLLYSVFKTTSLKISYRLNRYFWNKNKSSTSKMNISHLIRSSRIQLQCMFVSKESIQTANKLPQTVNVLVR